MQMVAREEILMLKTKLLPSGADPIIDFLASKHDQLEFTQIVLENVPLLIIGRHGMIARIPVGGKLQKVSHPEEILQTLQSFFNKSDLLYVFINLPDLPIPPEVTEVLLEVGKRAEQRAELRRKIDEALDRRDRALFDEATAQLKALEEDAANVRFPDSGRR